METLVGLCSSLHLGLPWRLVRYLRTHLARVKLANEKRKPSLVVTATYLSKSYGFSRSGRNSQTGSKVDRGGCKYDSLALRFPASLC
jgi:hypothetical protein